MNPSAVLALALLSNPSVEAVDRPRPNLVILVLDDVGRDAIAVPGAGNELRCHTPHLQRLAQSGVSFANARVNPVCSPTRAGLLSGRHALQTGVAQVLGASDPLFAWFGLQGGETTIAEVLQAAGYATLHVDKWHLGHDDQLGQNPLQQGFDQSYPMEDYRKRDRPDQIGDEHLSRMVDLAVGSVKALPQDQPYALFFWAWDAHDRSPDQDGLHWWKMDPALAPSTYAEGEPDPPTDLFRFRAVMESVDHELCRLLTGLDILDGSAALRPDSGSVVFCLGDNGTDAKVAAQLPAKASLKEGGIHVPFFAFGEGVPRGVVDQRLVSHVDFYDTLADIARVPIAERGRAPRASWSFADSLGRAPAGSLPRRRATVSSLALAGTVLSSGDYSVAIVDHRYKLIAPAGQETLAPSSLDEFYDLRTDPGETVDLIRAGMDAEQWANYRALRALLADEWATAVAEPANDADLREVDVAIRSSFSERSDGTRSLAPLSVGHLVLANGRQEWRANLRLEAVELAASLPAGFHWRDLSTAQLLLFFEDDADPTLDSDVGIDTGCLHVSLAHTTAALDLGQVDLAPHLIADPSDEVVGMPMPPGAPLSFGRSTALGDAVLWSLRTGAALELVVAADRHEEQGDQRVQFRKGGLLRLTFFH